jgi:hypothetical protein
MNKRPFCIALLSLALLLAPASALGDNLKRKEEAVASIEKHQAELVALQRSIWGLRRRAARGAIVEAAG